MVMTAVTNEVSSIRFPGQAKSFQKPFLFLSFTKQDTSKYGVIFLTWKEDGDSLDTTSSLIAKSSPVEVKCIHTQMGTTTTLSMLAQPSSCCAQLAPLDAAIQARDAGILWIQGTADRTQPGFFLCNIIHTNSLLYHQSQWSSREFCSRE